MSVVVLALVVGCHAHEITLDSVGASSATRYTTSWLGNSFGGPQWVQSSSDALYTSPDGHCYLAAVWDEGGHEYGIYKDGQVVGAAESTHGWGYGGGTAVTANSHYLFIAQWVAHLESPQSPNLWPEKGRRWFGVGRRTLDGKLAPFPGGTGHGSNINGGVFAAVNTAPEKTDASIKGLAASDTQLFVANPYSSEIDVYNCGTMAKTGSWPMSNPAQMTYDATSSSLWIVQSKDSTGQSKILHFSITGQAFGTAIVLPAGAVPSGVCVTPDGRLLVADSGEANQILVYGSLNSRPELMNTFGIKGGIYSGVPGRVGPLKFCDPVGVGVDKAGNIYVASQISGTYLESYTPTGKQNWELNGLEFTSCADIDPESPNDVYTPTHHYRLDLSKPSGLDSRYVGFLADGVHNPRLIDNLSSVLMRRINGKRFLFGLDMNAGNLQVYRFTGKGDLTAASAMFSTRHLPDAVVATPQPGSNGWIWRDANGDGRMEPNELDSTTDNVGCTAWSVDVRGDVWQAVESPKLQNGGYVIKHFPCKGLDSIGNPIYSASDPIVNEAPEPFNDRKHGAEVERMQYVPETDTMYLSGFTALRRNDSRDWKTSGPVFCCYDNWSSHPAKRWQIEVPFESAQVPGSHFVTPDAFSVAGKRLFVGYLKDGEIKVFNTDDGKYLFSLLPGPEVNHLGGWIDAMYGVHAEQLKNGEYLVFAEEVLHEKVLMYRFSQ